MRLLGAPINTRYLVIHRFGGTRTLTAMREWLDYLDRQVATMERHNDGGD